MSSTTNTTAMVTPEIALVFDTQRSPEKPQSGRSGGI